VRPLRNLVNGNERIGGDRLALALQLEQKLLSDFDRSRHEPERVRSDQHLTRPRRLLQPRSDVHGIASGETLLGAGEHLASIDADPTIDTEVRQGIAHLHRRAARPECIVLVRRRYAEHRHHRITDELLHQTAVRLHDRLHPLEIARQQPL
jgi:hypothetical protein